MKKMLLSKIYQEKKHLHRNNYSFPKAVPKFSVSTGYQRVPSPELHCVVPRGVKVSRSVLVHPGRGSGSCFVASYPTLWVPSSRFY